MINQNEDVEITLYSFNELNIYCGQFQYMWATGTGFATNSTNIEPPVIQEQRVPVWIGDKWNVKEDHRGKTVYSTKDQIESKVDYVGEIKDGFTELKPNSQFDIWNGKEWIDPRSEEEKIAYKRSQYPKLTRYQFLRCLLENGHKSSDIEAQIMQIKNEFTRELTLLGFKDASDFVRTDESILAMQSVLKLTDGKLDDIWEYAMTL